MWLGVGTSGKSGGPDLRTPKEKVPSTKEHGMAERGGMGSIVMRPGDTNLSPAHVGKGPTLPRSHRE